MTYNTIMILCRKILLNCTAGMVQYENADNWALMQYEWVVEGVLMGIVGVLGIIGNISAIAIFWARFYKKSGTNKQTMWNGSILVELVAQGIPSTI
jgi:heme/copper-type cytochrome/quinol oxidase subunit 2